MGDRLVFIDESGAKTSMTRLRGRALKGDRAHDAAPLCCCTVRTMISSIRLDGSKACMTIDAPTDGAVFHMFTEQVLVSALRSGDIVVMDNLGRPPAGRDRRRDRPGRCPGGIPAGLLARLQPHRENVEQSERNPEAAKARISDALDAAIEVAFQSVTPHDAAFWFAACDYMLW